MFRFPISDSLFPLALLFRRSVSGFGVVSGSAKRFINQAGHFDALFHALIQYELNDGREPCLQSVGQFLLYKPRSMTKAVHAELLFLWRSHHRDKHLGVLQISGYLGPRHSHILNARIA